MQYLKLIFVLLLFISCISETKTSSTGEVLSSEISFDKLKWDTKEGYKYPFRDQMLNDIVYNDTIRSLNKKEILKKLGPPDRINEGHLYYLIDQKRIGPWPLHTKTMVIKLRDDDKIAWIKIHA